MHLWNEWQNKYVCGNQYVWTKANNNKKKMEQENTAETRLVHWMKNSLLYDDCRRRSNSTPIILRRIMNFYFPLFLPFSPPHISFSLSDCIYLNKIFKNAICDGSGTTVLHMRIGGHGVIKSERNRMLLHMDTWIIAIPLIITYKPHIFIHFVCYIFILHELTWGGERFFLLFTLH